ncbi:MAG TPA: acetyl-CoA carboxylase biotin carboxylase subunit, partial [Dehalococcoidia bacterium]|nr:acetyl-CoA carboxylase biotin carboxylase subunit [Dehalococcoidia bacterium]
DVYMEKYLQKPRHIEMQILADGHGNVVHLGERDCSLQRKHQKVLEEAPSPVLSPEQRAQIGKVACDAIKKLGYRNAGTIEFLYENGQFYFIEMNTRLQVEHPVTELVTGADLVADQIRVAAGDQLGYPEEPQRFRGWAIECRISAEDPEHNFVPSVGTIAFAREPAGPGIRVESALYNGFTVSEFYDPLVAKVTAWGRDRREAIRRMRRALHEFQIVGVRTNLPFHMAVMEDTRFLAGEFDTGFLNTEIAPAELDTAEARRAAVAVAALLSHQRRHPLAGLAAQAFDGQLELTNGAKPAETAGAGWKRAGRAASAATLRGTGWRRITG